MGKKTRLGSLGRALLVVAAAAAAVAVLAGGARAEPQAAGFDVLASLLARVKENIDATHRVTVASFQQTQEQCAAALLPVQAEIDQRQTTLNASAARVQDAENQQKSLAAQFQPLNDRIAADLLEQGKLAERVRAGDAQREAEAALVRGKVQANVDLTETVSRLVARLAAVNTTQFSFREALGDGTAASAAAAARIGEALQAQAGAPELVVKAGDEVTVARLRTLLSLLRAELQEFQQQVGSHEEETAQAWADQRAKLAARIDELYKDAKSAEAAKDVLTAKIAEQKAIVEKEQAVLAGPLVAEVNKWNERKKAIVDGCELKRKHFEAEEKARESQQTTIQALAKLSAAHADSGSDLGIAGISIPQPALCCTKCSGATPMACGDSCVSLEVAKTSRCHVGCACGESDPRLAGLQQ